MDEGQDRRDTSAERAGAAIGIAMNESARDPSLAEDARTLLREQARLARLQADDLSEEGALMRRSLRVKHASDMMKFAFELLVALVLLAIVAALATAMWSAAHDNGLVIEAFSVPPDLAQRCLSRELLASQLLDKLARMQQQTNSVRPADTYRNNWGDDIKVEIPDTGISIGELNRYLTRWLGHETHITGEIYHTPSGIAVTTRAQDGGETFAGKNGDLDGLLQKAAESIYAQTQPYRYAAFLGQVGRDQEAMHVVERLAGNAAPAERAWALSLLGNLYTIYRGPADALATLRAGVAADPTNAHAWDNLSSAEQGLDRAEDGYHHTQQALSLYDKGAVAFDPDRATIDKLQDRAFLASTLGDYPTAIAMDEAIRRLPDRGGSQDRAAIDEAAEAAQNHDLRRARNLLSHIHAADTNGRLNLWFQAVDIAWLGHDWRTLSQLVGNRDIVRSTPVSLHPLLGRIVARIPASLYADARAEQGDIAGARALIAPTPLDCYSCLRMRGKIDADAKDWAGAARWFARATQAGPSIPDAFADWGEMLLHKGDLDGAIAKFEIAHVKAPRFADSLERWGEALMQKNRSDLALAKFEEAGKYAPNWGRLHLKWGAALCWSGNKADAARQFATSSTLDLTPSEKSELARVEKLHGG
jgi:tetratricopeptide (TPR) repeat protein